MASSRETDYSETATCTHSTHGARLRVVDVAADGVEELVVAAVVLIIVDPRHL